MKNKKDEIMMTGSPSKSVMTVLVFSEDGINFPLQKQMHENLFSLSEITDLVFIFSGKRYKNIDLDKFSTLYSATAWIWSDTSGVTNLLFKSLQYGKEIFENYVSYLIGSIKDIGGNIDKITKNILPLTMSGLTWPVLKLTRLTPEEMYDIYSPKSERIIEEKDSLTAWYDSFWKPDEEYLTGENKFSTYKSTSRLLFFKARTINQFVDLWWDNPEEHYWINTFTWSDPRYLLSCLCVHLGLKIQDNNMEDITI